MVTRTLGWIQNPSKFENLKHVVSVFVHGSTFHKHFINTKLPIILKNNLITKDLYDDFIGELSKTDIVIPYGKLKGKGPCGKSRSDSPCTGIIQATIDAQKDKELINEHGDLIKMKKPYTDDWSADGYLRWAIATGLLNYNRKDDTCSISELGKHFANTIDNSEEERKVLTKALLSYSPVHRVLEILSDKMPHTKFEIASKFGFKGELGFTSIPQEVFLYDYCEETDNKKRNKIIQDTEGDCDKYVRTIIAWCIQMCWIEKCEKTVQETYLGKTNKAVLPAWKITRSGEKALIFSNGYSKIPQIEKIVMFEMLASNKVPNAEYIRLRRALILHSLKTYRTVKEIQKYLERNGLKETTDVIEDEISNFKNIGLYVTKIDEKYKLLDKIIKLDIPAENSTVTKSDINKLKDEIRANLHNINHDYLVLVDLAYSDASNKKQKNSDARTFELLIAKLLTEELHFLGQRLGDSDKPDVIAYRDNFGIIIDAKSYMNGFSVDRHSADEMIRYVDQNKKRIDNIPKNEWWKKFDPHITDFYFLFVTSFLKGRFQDNIEEISKLTCTNGAVINVANLLYLAEELKSGKKSYSDIPLLFQNKEIEISI